MRGALVATTALVAWTGHLGGAMVWGPGFAWEPLVKVIDEMREPGAGGGPATGSGAAPDAAAGAPDEPGSAEPGGDPSLAAKLAFYQAEVLPIFESRCYECHGGGKRKGGLRMDMRASMLAKDSSGLHRVKPGAPAESLLVTRVMLPDSDDLSMPPEGDRLAAAQLDAIRRWIEDGAVMPEGAPAGAGAGTGRAAGAGVDGAIGTDAAPAARGPEGSAAGRATDAPRERRAAGEGLAPLSPDELAAASRLGARGLRVAPVSRGGSTLAVSVPGGSSVGDVDVAAIFPVAQRVEELSLARSGVTDAGVMAMPSMPNARTVRLDNTALTDAGIIAVLSRTLDAETVNLVNTRAGDGVFAMLGKLPYLRKAYLQGTMVSAEAVAAFRAQRPEVELVLER